MHEQWLIDWVISLLNGEIVDLREWLEGGERVWSKKPDLVSVFDQVSAQFGDLDVTSSPVATFLGLFWARAKDPATYGYSEELGEELRSRIEPLAQQVPIGWA